MKSLSSTLVIVIIFSLTAFAQAPLTWWGINYQTAVRDANGAPLANQVVDVQFSIIEPGGNVVFTDIPQFATTNGGGIVSFVIGYSRTNQLKNINWASGEHFLQVEMDIDGDGVIDITSTSQLQTVPYAIHANTADYALNDQVNDADADSTNELQSLTLTGNTLSLSHGGGSVTLPTGGIPSIANGLSFNPGTGKLEFGGTLNRHTIIDGNNQQYEMHFNGLIQFSVVNTRYMRVVTGIGGVDINTAGHMELSGHDMYLVGNNQVEIIAQKQFDVRADDVEIVADTLINITSLGSVGVIARNNMLLKSNDNMNLIGEEIMVDADDELSLRSGGEIDIISPDEVNVVAPELTIQSGLMRTPNIPFFADTATAIRQLPTRTWYETTGGSLQITP